MDKDYDLNRTESPTAQVLVKVPVTESEIVASMIDDDNDDESEKSVSVRIIDASVASADADELQDTGNNRDAVDAGESAALAETEPKAKRKRKRQPDKEPKGKKNKFITTKDLLKESSKYDARVHKVHPLLQLLKKLNTKVNYGWLRENEAILAKRRLPLRKQLTDSEREFVTKFALQFKSMQIDGLYNRLAWAWGLSNQTLSGWVKKAPPQEVPVPATSPIVPNACDDVVMDTTTSTTIATKEETKQPADTTIKPLKTKKMKKKIITTKDLLKESAKYNATVHKVHPLLALLNKINNNVNSGWLRKNEAIAAKRKVPRKKSLSVAESELLVKLALPFKTMNIKGLFKSLAWAWGISNETLQSMLNTSLPHKKERRTTRSSTTEPKRAIPRIVQIDPEALITTNYLFKESLNYIPHVDKVHPVVQILNQLNTKDNFGWLRKNEAIAAQREVPPPKKQLIEEERELVLKLALPFTIMKIDGVTLPLCWAWGISDGTLRNIIKIAKVGTTFSFQRKKRKDYGESVLTSDRKRSQFITEFMVFKRMIMQERRKQIELATVSTTDEAAAAAASEAARAIPVPVNGVYPKNAATGAHNLRLKQYTNEEVRTLWKQVPESEKEKYKELAEEHRSKLIDTLQEIEKIVKEQGPSKNLSMPQIQELISANKLQNNLPLISKEALARQLRKMKFGHSTVVTTVSDDPNNEQDEPDGVFLSGRENTATRTNNNLDDANDREHRYI